MNSIIDKMKEASALVAEMTLEEKASLLSGESFWRSKAIERLGVPSFVMTDGPHGVRLQGGTADNLGINESVPATCFPPAATSSCSFDRAVYGELGNAIGEECRKMGVSVILGPAVNIKRNPLCGRNFEYVSEDPYLAGELAAEMVNGVQKNNVGVSVKHYFANSQEKRRMCSDSVIDERAMREIYLTAFETVIKKSQPWTLMCAYNKINGTYACENKRSLTDIPRGEWGYEGAIMTDWGAMDYRPDAVSAGLDLEMPGNGGANDKLVVKAVKDGKLDEKLVDICAARMVAIALKQKDNERKEYDVEAHNALARKIGAESAVLLENNGVLPLKKTAKIALIGAFAEKPRYQGAGSSKINPTKLTSVIDEFKAQGVDYVYCEGYNPLSGDVTDKQLVEAVKAAEGADAVVAIVGLPASYESEGFDREHISMPDGMNKLVTELSKANPSTAVLLETGSSVAIPYAKSVGALLLLGLTGQNNGGVVFDILFGDVCPSGKLSETYPLALEDNASSKNFAGDTYTVEYRESVFVGYRYYDTAEKEVLYPFGYGLSYSTFEYSDIKLDKPSASDSDTVTASVTVKNTGKCDAKTVVELYIASPESKIFKPLRELKGFEKVFLKAGESKEVTFKLCKRSFAFYNVNISDWYAESGVYLVQIGTSSRDIVKTAKIEITSSAVADVPDYSGAAPSYYAIDNLADVSKKEFEAVLGREVPIEKPLRPFTVNTTIGQTRVTALGRLFAKAAAKAATKAMSAAGGDSLADDISKMMDAMIYDMPLRSMLMIAEGKITLPQVEGLANILDGRLIKGIKNLTTKI